MLQAKIDDQIAFLSEIDKLKTVNRATILSDNSRRENSAEHSWHVTVFALIFSDHANKKVDLFKAIKMLLIHDIVEIDTGDTPIFGTYDALEVKAQEEKAATRIFGLLPKVQAKQMIQIWNEFEEGKTATAQFARSMDRFQAPVQNLISGGGTWNEYNVTFEQVEKRVGSKIVLGAPKLWAWLRPRIIKFLKN
tara:strand:- start:526 stop:1104 length:579 start_codon:yes stop_codon:yes gene_type:complete